MKIKTSKVASSFNIHPAHFLQHLAELSNSLSFDDVWPEIEDSWVDTFSVASGHTKKEKDVEKHESRKIIDDIDQKLSASAIHVLDKLYRQGKWEKFTIPFEALAKITHLSMHIIQDVVSELKKKEFLDHDGAGRGGISLNSARRNDIEFIIKKKD